MKPTHVYVFGPLSGPYKIGYTCNLKTRSYELRMMRMSQHAIAHSAKQHSIFWFYETVPDRQTADAAEKRAHKFLNCRKLAHPRALGHPHQEWFDVDLTEAMNAVKRAVAEIVPSRAEMIRRLIERGSK